MLELIGAVLLFGLGTTAVALWFALAKLNARYDTLEIEHTRLIAEHLTLLYQESEQGEQ